MIKYLIQKDPGPLQYKDYHGLTAFNYMDNNTLRVIWGTHQIGSVADKSSDIDRLNYLLYAQALAYAARQAEQPGASLCVGLYGRYVAFTFTELIRSLTPLFAANQMWWREINSVEANKKVSQCRVPPRRCPATL